MKKTLLLLSVMLMSFLYVNAQTTHPLAIENQYPGDSLMAHVMDEAVADQNRETTTATSATWISNRGRDNWFISVNAGIAQLMSEETRYMDFKDQIKPTFAVAFGKWFSPVWGLRMQFTGAELQGFATWAGEGENGHGLGSWYIGKNHDHAYFTKQNTNNYLPAWASKDGSNATGRALIYNRFLKDGKYLTTDEGPGYTYNFTYVSTSIDFLLNLKNLTLPYRHNAPFNPVIYAGLGYAHTLKDGDRTAVNSIMLKSGVQLGLRLSDRWDIFADGQMLFLPEFFDRRVGDGNTMDGVGNYTLGLTYRFNARHFIKAPLYDQAEIDRLNEEINILRKRPIECPPVCPPICPTCPVCSDCPEPMVNEIVAPEGDENLKFLPTPVFFLINSWVIRNSEMASIRKAVEFLKANPNHKLKLTGYADKQTGTPAINRRLSEQRAKAVADMLVNQYNVDRSRLEIGYLGDKYQPFAENDWNRVVIFIVPK